MYAAGRRVAAWRGIGVPIAVGVALAVCGCTSRGGAGTHGQAAGERHAKPSTAASQSSARRSATARWCRQLPRFTAYYAGSAFGRLRATSADVSCSPRYEDESAEGDVDYGYGSCHVSDESGCSDPFEVQSSPLCSRHPALYTTGFGRLKPNGRLRVRGVPAAWYEGKSRLEIYTRRTTIIVFGSHPRPIRRLARQLRVVPRYNLPRHPGPERSHFRDDPPLRSARDFKPASKRALRTRRSCG